MAVAAMTGGARRLLAFLLDPGRPEWAPLVVRVLVGGLFVSTGMGKFLNHDTYIERFERWGFGGAASEVAYLVGVLEVVCGLMLVLGVVPRLPALALIGNMIGALATAGRIDGGQDIWLPIVLIVLLSAIAWRGAGRLALAPGVRPPRSPRTRTGAAPGG